MEKRESREIQHLSHNHRLTLDEDNKAGGVRCDGCLQPISSGGPVYTCTPCHFFLHKFCAELPEKMIHPFHIEHQLSLLPNVGPSNDYICDICRQERPTGFSYNCDGCDFFVDINCASIMIKTQQPMEMEHGSHKHKLIPIEKSSNLWCDVCATKHEGSSYVCIECGFLVNQECAFLPPTIQLSDNSHRHDHDLTLIHSVPYYYYKSSPCCQICSERVFRNQWVYSCSDCGYFVHIKCIPSAFKIAVEKKERQEVQHWSHYHRLTLLKESEEEDVFCDGCLQPISSGRMYACARCQFFLHKHCAELPEKITHPSHIEHQLTLLRRAGRWRNAYICDICRLVRPTEFSYHCGDCDFFVDIKCASIMIKMQQPFKIQQPVEIERGSHKHKWIPLEKSSNFLCDVCARKHEGSSSYVCIECGFLVNQECAFLPPTVLLSDDDHHHDHNLSLIHSIPYRYYKNYSSCKICMDRIYRNQWVYSCSDCGYFVHIKCLPPSKTQHPRDGKAETEKRIRSVPRFPWANERPEEFAELVAQLVKNIVSSEEKKATYGDELRKISHIHDYEPLIFSADLQTDKGGGSSSSTDACDQSKTRKCNVCIQTISTSFYYCAEQGCNFYIHQQCAKLPTELDYSCHPEHPLRLMSREFLDYYSPECECCGIYWNTFYFGCGKCDFYIDVKCAGIPSGIKHESHEHRLTLRPFFSCSICISILGYYAFVCEACSYNVCFRCALLPGKVSHRYDEHPFALTYSSPFSVKDNDQLEDEFKKKEYYYCEICEKDIDHQRWFYHCIKCDQSLHIKCICPSIDLMYSKIDL